MKKVDLFRSKIGIFDIFFKKLHEILFEDLQINSILKIPNPLCPIKWWPTKVFVKLHKSPLLIANIINNSLRSETIFGNWKPLKTYEKCFLKNFKMLFKFHLKSSFCSQDNESFVLTFWKFLKNGLIREKRLISEFMTLQRG